MNSVEEVENLELGFLEVVIGCSIDRIVGDLVNQFEVSDNDYYKPNDTTLTQDESLLITDSGKIDEIVELTDHLNSLISLDTPKQITTHHINSKFAQKQKDNFCEFVHANQDTHLEVILLQDSPTLESKTSISILQSRKCKQEEQDTFCSLIKATKLDDSPKKQEKRTNPLNLMSDESLGMIKTTFLPDSKLFNSYGDLYYTAGLKTALLRQITSTSSSHGKMILLYGPPGSGKTTLCKAVSNLIISCSNHGERQVSTDGVLIEILCARIFSMYLNQSDKNLDSLFTDLIRVLSKYPKLKVVLLIDEIETLVRSRQ
ncbi:unnamed protein product [Ambrosiozyma monospora]|uniref:Unnamed protein product n=1 Tax=Ambrosiozyma monospora TaxID=43982 RepID=A0ACB5U2A1_AMBMO|nr:unnamed protein product [Ambrosiozyma monospora]